MTPSVMPDYHAVISPMLLELRRGTARPKVLPQRRPAPRAPAVPHTHALRQDGRRPYRLNGALVASSVGAGVSVDGVAFTRTLDVYLDADSNLVVHVVLDPVDADGARSRYTVVGITTADDATALCAVPARPGVMSPSATKKNLSSIEGTQNVLSHAVA